MDAIQLLLLSIILYSVSALVALLGVKGGIRLAVGVLGVLAALAGVFSAGMALLAADAPSLVLFQMAPFGQFEIQLDGLSAFLVGLIGLIGVATSVYSLASPANQRLVSSQTSISFFTNTFMASMLVVVTVGNAFFFLVFWELMTLASYFLVIWETEKKEAIQTGFIYMVVAHAGAALIMVAFFILFQKAGTFDFSAFRRAYLPDGLKNLVFFLAFLGFGAKAGMVPLHFWTPATYAAAPSQVSALMAGVMKKTAVYGILRICVDLLGAPVWWWGLTVLAFGGLSTVLGAFYALAERDIKRLLAYSSVENVGIILMGVGVGMIGLAAHQSALAVLGFLAALYHLLNHAFFKGLLFLGTGPVIDQVGTHDLNRMGGLGRRMPWTALTFLAGALAVSAIPPFNGFVSEWFTYQSLFFAGRIPLFALRVFAPLFAVLLALAGAFAVMVYIKAYGGAFTGPARSQAAAEAQEAPAAIRVSMVYLALGCLVLGLGAPWIAPWIANVAADFAGTAAVRVSNGWQVFPAQPALAVLSTPLVAGLLLGLLLVPWLVVWVYRGFQPGRRRGVEPWSCGYGYAAPMSVTASSFDQPVKVSFHPLYWLRTLVDKPFQRIAEFSRTTLSMVIRLEPVIERVVTRPTTRLVEVAGQLVQAMQMGDIRVYCLYIILTLAILLFAIFGRSGL